MSTQLPMLSNASMTDTDASIESARRNAITFGRGSMALEGAGAVIGGIGQASAMRANAGTMNAEAGIAATQGYEQEAQQRRGNAMALGRETAAVGQAGAGYGGSAARAVGQSAMNTELDALNIRYKAQMQRWAFTTQAGNLKSEANITEAGGFLRAGAALLKGYSPNYTGGGVPSTAQADNGLQSWPSRMA
jgi:hypothetical protein